MSNRVRVVACLAILTGLAAAAGSGAAGSSPPPAAELATQMLGLTVPQARELAETNGLSLRVRDNYNLLYHDDYQDGRITVQAYEGVVTAAALG